MAKKKKLNKNSERLEQLAKRRRKYKALYRKYTKGESLEQLAKSIGVSRQALHKAFKLRKYAMRGPDFTEYTKL